MKPLIIIGIIGVLFISVVLYYADRIDGYGPSAPVRCSCPECDIIRATAEKHSPDCLCAKCDAEYFFKYQEYHNGRNAK